MVEIQTTLATLRGLICSIGLIFALATVLKYRTVTTWDTEDDNITRKRSANLGIVRILAKLRTCGRDGYDRSEVGT